jgi:hypothetical protein
MKRFVSNRLTIVEIVSLVYFIISYIFVIISAFLLKIPTELMIISIKGLNLTLYLLIAILFAFKIFNH